MQVFNLGVVCMSCWDHRPRKNEAWTMNMWTQFNQNEVRKGCCLFFRGMHQCCSCLLIKCAPPVPNWNVTCNNWTSDAGWPWFLWISSNQGFSAEFSVSGVKLPRATFSKCPDLRNVQVGIRLTGSWKIESVHQGWVFKNPTICLCKVLHVPQRFTFGQPK